MTNYEKIKNMSIDEMAEYLSYRMVFTCTASDECVECNQCFRKWLESEVTDK